jgi:hypothetical protein
MLLRCESLEPPMSQLGQLGRCSDVRCTTALPPKADVHPRSCYVAFVPKPAASRCTKILERRIMRNSRDGQRNDA